MGSACNSQERKITLRNSRGLALILILLSRLKRQKRVEMPIEDLNRRGLTFVQSFLLVWGTEVFRRWSTGWRLEREKKEVSSDRGGEKTFGESRARSLGRRDPPQV